MADRILLGIAGSAAAFKGVVLASLLRKEGYLVDSVLTLSAQEFITPVQLSCVTGRAVYTKMFDQSRCDFIPHIELTHENVLMVIAPATANIIAKTALGIADDLLSSCILANNAPLIIAPSMNTRMWNNPATGKNVTTLEETGVVFAGPVRGELACGSIGDGRFMEPEDILDIIKLKLKLKGAGK